MVRLAESTLIRFIDRLTGVNTDDIYRRVGLMKNELNRLKSGYIDSAVSERMRSLYSDINSSLMMPQYLLIVVDKESDYKRAVRGIILNGVEYKRLLGTSAGVKTSTIIFVDASIRDELLRLLNNGRDMTKAAVPAKLESYIGLAASSSKPVSEPNGILVVDDLIIKFKDDYLQLEDDEESDEPILSTVIAGDVENDVCDGCGMISPPLLRRWAIELGEDENIGGACIRGPFLKGIVAPFDFVEFADTVASKYIVKDVWGAERDIRDVELVLTTSMLKLWDSYDSLEDYMRNFRENGYTLSVTKVVEPEQKEFTELNYQFIQGLDLTDDDIDELIAPTISDIAGVMGGDYRKASIYLKGGAQTASSAANASDDYIKALAIDNSVINDGYVRSQISHMIAKRCDRAKLGRVRARGDFSVICCDMYALAQHIFGLPITGLLSRGEAYSQYWNKRGVDEVLAMRAPMTNANSIRRLKMNKSDNAAYWFRYMRSMLVLNGFDMTCQAENGADCDGDTFFTTDNKVLFRRHEQLLPVLCVQKKATKIVPTEDDFVRANCMSFGNSIGSITNVGTAMYDVRSLYEKGTPEYEEINYRIIATQHAQQNSIDKAKGILSKDMCSAWRNRSAAAKTDDPMDIEIVASKKPYFMIYRYSNEKTQYNKYKSKCEFDSMWKFGKSLDELLTSDCLTEDESSYVYWYKKNSPVSLGNCTMNRLCRNVEAKVTEIKDSWKRGGENFSYSIYRSVGVSYTPQQMATIKNILDDYLAKIKTVPSYAKAFRLDEASTNEYRASLTDLAKEELYCNCPNQDVLCNIILDLTCSSGKTTSLSWSLVGDVMIKNLLNRSDGVIHYYVEDESGDIDFKGQKYKEMECNVVEELNDRACYE